jgi:UDP-N-acetylmuramate dehydrogenase
MRIPGISFQPEGDTVRVTVGAGVMWEELVTSVADRGLWGLENLAGIPGTMGAAPVQNIGAYGAEFSTVCTQVSGINMHTGERFTFATDECAFGYRDSIFKHHKELVITEVVIVLHTQSAPKLGYSDLARLSHEGVSLTTPTEINSAVRAVRALKFPDLSLQGTAGSFFKNPIISNERFAELSSKYGAIPSFPAKDGIKIPLAYILDHILGLKGTRVGHVSLFGNQPLVLVTDEGATAHDVDEFAQAIEKKVFDATGIKIQREVQKVFQK